MSEEQTKQNVSLEETFEQIETIIKQLESPEVNYMSLTFPRLPDTDEKNHPV